MRPNRTFRGFLGSLRCDPGHWHCELSHVIHFVMVPTRPIYIYLCWMKRNLPIRNSRSRNEQQCLVVWRRRHGRHRGSIVGADLRSPYRARTLLLVLFGRPLVYTSPPFEGQRWLPQRHGVSLSMYIRMCTSPVMSPSCTPGPLCRVSSQEAPLRAARRRGC